MDKKNVSFEVLLEDMKSADLKLQKSQVLAGLFKFWPEDQEVLTLITRLRYESDSI